MTLKDALIVILAIFGMAFQWFIIALLSWIFHWDFKVAYLISWVIGLIIGYVMDKEEC